MARLRTDYGLEFEALSLGECLSLDTSDWTDYDKVQMELHLANCGYVLLDTNYHRPIDNENDLDAIYKMMIF